MDGGRPSRRGRTNYFQDRLNGKDEINVRTYIFHRQKEMKNRYSLCFSHEPKQLFSETGSRPTSEKRTSSYHGSRWSADRTSRPDTLGAKPIQIMCSDEDGHYREWVDVMKWADGVGGRND